jgi:hypothetical protein
MIHPGSINTLATSSSNYLQYHLLAAQSREKSCKWLGFYRDRVLKSAIALWADDFDPAF